MTAPIPRCPTHSSGLVDDPEATAGIHELRVQRPTTSDGQGIDRGVAGKVVDNTPYAVDPYAREVRACAWGGGRLPAPRAGWLPT